MSLRLRCNLGSSGVDLVEKFVLTRRAAWFMTSFACPNRALPRRGRVTRVVFLNDTVGLFL